MEKEFDEIELHQKLRKMVFWKQQAFLLIVCQRLIPSFSTFAKETGFSGEKTLKDLIMKAWNSLLGGASKIDFSSEVAQAEVVAPDTEDFDSDYVSSALNAVVAISLLMKSFCDGQTDTIVEAVSLIRDSVDMYVQELENMNPNDSNIEKRILHHDLMQKELKRQLDDLQFIAALDNDISVSMMAVRDKWFDRKDSCLDLMQ